MYHLPLLPGYGPDTNVRSSVPGKPSTGKSFLSRLSEAEENGYQGTYFTSPAARSPTSLRDGYISSSSPVDTREARPVSPTALEHEGAPFTPASETELVLPSENEQEPEHDLGAPASFSDAEAPTERQVHWQTPPRTPLVAKMPDAEVGEVVFFEYGVVVFFGLEERQERDILEDIERAAITKRPIEEKDWEVEECHFIVSPYTVQASTVLKYALQHDPHIAYPRIYNDFFSEPTYASSHLDDLIEQLSSQIPITSP